MVDLLPSSAPAANARNHRILHRSEQEATLNLGDSFLDQSAYSLSTNTVVLDTRDDTPFSGIAMPRKEREEFETVICRAIL